MSIKKIKLYHEEELKINDERGFTIICNRCGEISSCKIEKYIDGSGGEYQNIGNFFEFGNEGIRCLSCNNEIDIKGD